MSDTLTSDQWLDAIDRHYLSEYLPGGGAAIKFAACYAGTNQIASADALRRRAEARSFLSVHINSATVKLHMIEQMFAAIADQIPWELLSAKILGRFAKENHWEVPAEFSSNGIVEQLNRLNNLGVTAISLELQRRIATDVLGNSQLAKEFRIAMHWLAKARLDSSELSGRIIAHIKDWLGCRTASIRELAQYQIFTKINRANARHLLGSLLGWIRNAGHPGIVITIDAFQVFATQSLLNGPSRYTPAQLLDTYEVFREFIDSTDELEGCLIVAYVPQEFLNVDPRGRGLGRYPALLHRVYDEVRARNLANPLTALTRICDLPEKSR